MASVVKSSKVLFAGMAFVATMAASGALLGAIAGMVLVLAAHTMLDVRGQFFEILASSIAVGAALLAGVGVALIGRQIRWPVWERPLEMAPATAESQVGDLLLPATETAA